MLPNSDIKTRFDYHAPDEKTRELHNKVREITKEFATTINKIPGPEMQGAMTREMALAFTALEECSFWLHAHIARNIG